MSNGREHRPAAGPSLDVVAFDGALDGVDDPRALLGGKGAGLAEMTRALDLPVPPGFTITTDVCRRFRSTGWPDGLDERIAEHLERVGRRLGRRFGEPEAPLLVSVRSGAPVSMPGMMDTLLNVGITPAIRDRLAAETASPAFAADTWLRFCRGYAEVALGVPADALDREVGQPEGVEAVLEAAERVRALVVRLGGSIPDEPHLQLRGAIEAVFRSWDSQRARVFRAREGISDDLGTAATVQAMVFGNLDDRSGTGVVFTRDPATGAPGPYGDYLARAQGEDVVAGARAVHGLDALRAHLPAVYDRLLDVLRSLERHYRDMCDVEFTVSSGELYILQTRIGARSPLAAVRIAVAMAEDPDFPLTRREAVERVGAAVLGRLADLGRVDPEAEPVATGLAASPGVAVGALCCDPDRAAELAAGGVPVVLAREETSPTDVHGMVGAAGLLTTRGGVASHAAVVARSWAIPAVTSLTGAGVRAGGLAIGDTWIAEGDLVTVDGSGGALYLGDRRAPGSVDVPEVRTLREWAAQPHSESASAAGSIHRRTVGEVTLLEVARTIQLKGLCSAEQAAGVLAAPVDAITTLVSAHAALFRQTPHGLVPTPECREWLQQQLAAERNALDAAALESCYARFLPLNDGFKRLVTSWQMSSADADVPLPWPHMLASLAGLHAEVRPLIDETAGHLPRLRRYARRLDAALDALRGGDASMLAAPLKDSYHTVWFEYHEELISLLGRDRASEERAESAR